MGRTVRNGIRRNGAAGRLEGLGRCSSRSGCSRRNAVLVGIGRDMLWLRLSLKLMFFLAASLRARCNSRTGYDPVGSGGFLA